MESPAQPGCRVGAPVPCARTTPRRIPSDTVAARWPTKVPLPAKVLQAWLSPCALLAPCPSAGQTPAHPATNACPAAHAARRRAGDKWLRPGIDPAHLILALFQAYVAKF